MARHIVRIRGLVLALALFQAGCLSWLDAQYAASHGQAPAKPEPPPPPPPPRCAAFAAGPTDVPSVADLRRALGEHLDSEIVRALFARLGAPKIYAATDGHAYDFPDRGVRFVFDDRGGGERVRKIELLARMQEHASYAGALPDGLRYGIETEDVDKILGEADFGRCIGWDPNWRARGLSVEFAGVCLGAIALIDAADAGTVSITEAVVRDHAVAEDEHGVRIALTTVVGPHFPKPNPEPYLGVHDYFATARLVDDSGAPLAETRISLPSYGEHTAELFFPYRTIKAPPGPVRAHLELSADPMPTRAPVPMHAPAPLPVAFDMAPLEKVRLNVAHVEVEPGVYDNTHRTAVIITVITGGAIPPIPGPKRWERPDLFWTVTPSGVRYLGDAWRSSVHEDVYAASWKQKSPWVTVAKGDPVDVCIEDEDPGSAESIGCLSMTPEELRAAAAEHRLLSQDKVKKLLIGSVEIR